MMNLLEVPSVFAGIDIQRYDRGREKIIARTYGAIVIGARIAGREIDHAKLRVHRRRMPNRAATGLPRSTVRRPGVRAKLTRGRHCIKSPQQATVVCIIGFNTPSCCKFSAGKATDHHAIKIQRRAGNGITFFPGFRLNRPDLLPSFLI